MARAACLRETGDLDAARDAAARAVALTDDPAVRAHLRVTYDLP